MKRNGNRNHGGMSLILVVGSLALLALLAQVFLVTTLLESRVGRNFADATRAMLAAESGLARAITALQSLDGGMDAGDIHSIFYDAAGDGYAAFPPLGGASAPSLNIDIDGDGLANDGISGWVADTYGSRGDFYKLRIEDESAKLNINDDSTALRGILIALCAELALPDIADLLLEAREAQANERFPSMTHVRAALAATLSDDQWELLRRHVTIHSWTDPDVIEPTLAIDDNADGQPDFRWKLSRGGAAVDAFRFRVLPGTVRADWEDPAIERDANGDIRLYHWMDMQTAHFRRAAGRSPVHLNAAGKPLLKALLAPVRGWYLEETPESLSRFGWRSGGIWDCAFIDDLEIDGIPVWSYLPRSEWPSKLLYYDVDEQIAYPSVVSYSEPLIEYQRIGSNSSYGVLRRTDPLTDEQIERIADALWRRVHAGGFDANGDGEDDGPMPFHGWQELGLFLRGLVDAPDVEDGIDNVPDFRHCQADAILANANPNTRLNDYNPDSLLFQLVDKSQLEAYSTEFCLEPTGAFSIHSLGVMRDAAGGTVAEAEIHAVARLFEWLRLTTQRQFLSGYTGDSPDPMDLYWGSEASARHASLSESDGQFSTSGATVAATGESMAGGKRGYALAVYPEPVTVAPLLTATDPDLPLWDGDDWHGPWSPPAWHEGWQGGAGPGTPGFSGFADTDWNYIDDCFADGGIGLATLQPERGEAALGMELPQAMANFDKTIRLSKIGPGGSRAMAGGYSASGELTTYNVAPNYPAGTFTQSPLLIAADMYATTDSITQWEIARAGLDFGGPVPAQPITGPGIDPLIFPRVLFSRVPTPQNFPTIDRLTYPYPETPNDPESRRIPGVLLPDGALSDSGRTISFPAVNAGFMDTVMSLDSCTGSLQFWVKPNWDPARSSRLRSLVSLQPVLSFAGDYNGNRGAPGDCFDCIYFCRGGIAGVTEASESGTLYNGGREPHWLPRNAIGAFMNTNWSAYEARCTGTAHHGGDTHAEDHDGGFDAAQGYLYNFEGRKWNHVGLSWRFASYIGLVINGLPALRATTPTDNPLDFYNEGFWYEFDEGDTAFAPGYLVSGPGRKIPWLYRDPYEGAPRGAAWADPFAETAGDSLPIDPVNYLRLGALCSDTQRNYTADATYDEVMTYRQCHRGDRLQNEFATIYAQGRYHAGSMAERNAGFYTSSRFDAATAGAPPHAVLQPRSISWSLAWPQLEPGRHGSGNRSATDANLFTDLRSTAVNPLDRVNAGLPDPEWDPIVADVYTTGNGWLFGDGDDDLYDHAETMATCAHGSDIRTDRDGLPALIGPGEAFRFRLYFNLLPGEVVYETPYVDDVTLTLLRDHPVFLEYMKIQK